MRLITIPQPVTLTADRDLMRKIVSDFLSKDEGFWDVLVKARSLVARIGDDSNDNGEPDQHFESYRPV